MQQQEDQPLQSAQSLYIVNSSIKATFQTKPCKSHFTVSSILVHTIIILNKTLRNHLVFIYLSNGEWVLYSIKDTAVVKQGNIDDGINKFFLVSDVEELLIAYFSTTAKALRVLDLRQQTILDVFSPSFPSALALTKHTRNEQNTQRLLNDSKLYILPGSSDQEYYYIVVQEQQASLSTDFGVVYSLLQLPKDVLQLTPQHCETQLQYEYANLTEQRDMFGSIIDCDTVAFFGQDQEPGKYEFLLMRPKLGCDKWVSTVYIPDTLSYTLQDITPWVEEGQVAIWLNNNESNSQPFIDVLDYETYFACPNANVASLKKMYNPNRLPLRFQNEVATDFIILHINYVGSEMIMLEKSIGSKRFVQLIETSTLRVLYSSQINNGKRIEAAPDGSYFIVCEPQIMNPHDTHHELFLQCAFVLDYKLALIRTMISTTKLFGDSQEQPTNINLLQDIFSLLFD